MLWAPTLFAQTLAISPADASFLMIWVGLGGLIGRFLFSWLSETIGRRPSGVLLSFGAAFFCWLAGVYHDAFIGGVSMLFLMILLSRFFGDGGYAVVGPYAAEVWPSGLRASGMGFGYGLGNFGKVMGPLGLALIAGSSNYVNPKADLAALGLGDELSRAWSVMAGWCSCSWASRPRDDRSRKSTRHCCSRRGRADRVRTIQREGDETCQSFARPRAPTKQGACCNTSAARCFRTRSLLASAIAHARFRRVVHAGRAHGLAYASGGQTLYCLSGVGRICFKGETAAGAEPRRYRGDPARCAALARGGAGSAVRASGDVGEQR